MKKIASILFAQLLAVASIMPLARLNVVAAPPSDSKGSSTLGVPDNEQLVRVLHDVEQQLADGAEEFTGRCALRPSSSNSAPVQNQDLDEEACNRIAKDLMVTVKRTEQNLSPITSKMNEQMGVFGSKLNINQFKALFTGVMEKTERGAAKRGINLQGAAPGGPSSGGMAGGVLGAIGTLQTVITIMEDWDKETEYIWASDLVACGMAHNPTEAFEKAEAMGDIRLHFYIENETLRGDVAALYHDRELEQDGRFCFSEKHEDRKQKRKAGTRPGSDYHVPSRPGRPNSNHGGDPRTSGACKTYTTEVVYITDDQGNYVDSVVTLTCIEYW